ncbi:transmembrane protein 242 isoform X2 [Nasonia vitripennis]|uniref:Transmembrane protein 242 n=1 Tax=Nasonia vitripennis TaxID=7425 RepID=A0A7M7G362_NASVI|nr:transmembrane protein 242 isoform X2 [Nasonia vitripennis]XP_008210768.1 transmembrane protein 242 isoform X2 [Nasonia vitripennis]XP_031784744.1 transmembrane protein 242 isoform X2 [Nasonia vitripennis]
MSNKERENIITLNKNVSNESNPNDHDITGAIFLVGVTGIFFFSGFSSSLATLRRKSPKLFSKGLYKNEHYNDTGADLALRALKWGSFYSVISCSAIFYGIWKLSGASSFKEFRCKMKNILPQISKDPSLHET